MNARDEVLSALRRRDVEPIAHPGKEGPWTSYPNRIEVFRDRAGDAGAQVIEVDSVSGLTVAARRVVAGLKAQRTISLLGSDYDLGLPGVETQARGPVADVDFLAAWGELGVAENGAIWVQEPEGADRAVFFLTQHLALVLRPSDLVDNMHRAYERVRPGGSPFGCFISGPSKTADIEQALVIGAHGPRSLTVFLLAD